MDFDLERLTHMKLFELGRYLRDREVPRWKRWLVFGAVAYTVMPLDLIPDTIPVIGWLDDVGVLAAVFAYLSRDVARWSQTRSSQRDATPPSASSGESGSRRLSATSG